MIVITQVVQNAMKKAPVVSFQINYFYQKSTDYIENLNSLISIFENYATQLHWMPGKKQATVC